MTDPLPLVFRWGARSNIRDIVLLAAVAATLASFAFLLVRFSEPTPQLLDQARALAFTGRETMPFFQTGYVAMLAAGLRFGGQRGIFALQAIAYVADVLLAYVLVISTGAQRRAAIAAALVLAVHPYLVFNIKRIVDNNIAIPALLTATLAIAAVWRTKAPRTRGTVAAGLAMGFAMFARSNYAPLLLLMLGAFVVRGSWKEGTVATVIAITIVLAGNRLASGYWRLSPSEGGYTFYIGANPFTADALIRNYNPEPSLAAAAAADGLDFNGLQPYTFANSREVLFWRLGLIYVVRHPFDYFWLGVLKLLTLLRPDYRQVGQSMTASAPILILVQTLLALILPGWVVLRLILRHEVGLFDGIWAIPIVMVLLLAVVLVAGDPRYRLTVEAIAIIDSAWCYDAWRPRSLWPYLLISIVAEKPRP